MRSCQRVFSSERPLLTLGRSQSGVEGFNVVAWYGLFAPARTPTPVLTRLSAETQAVLRQPDVVQRIAAEGSEAIGTIPAEFAAHLKAESAKRRKVIDQAGIRGE